MSKRITLFVFAGFLLAAACAFRPTMAGGEESAEVLLPRAAFAPALASNSGALRLIAKKFTLFEGDGLILTPASVTVAETLETPVLASVSIPRDNNRTHFLLGVGVLQSWQQVASTAPYRMTGSLRLRLTSSSLPPPGEMSFGIGLHNQQVDSQASAVDIARISDQTSSFGLDDESLPWLVKANFPALTDEQALEMTRALIESEVGMELRLRTRVRSVQEFDITNAYLQVWGD
ncbi:MAG TPA: hypothetical protein VJT74_09600 [Pyrinomonadaceae bacterium]|nr:hypothetical protein [Pyrinomonadaceae bacterium]